MKKRTMIQWIYCIKDDDLRKAALNYYKLDTQNIYFHTIKYENFITALLRAFNWAKTSEGFSVWHNLCKDNENIEIKLL